MKYAIVEQQDMAGRPLLVIGRVNPTTGVLQDEQVMTEPVLLAVARFVAKFCDGMLERSTLSAAGQARLELVVRSETVPVVLEDELPEMPWSEIQEWETELRGHGDDGEQVARHQVVRAELIRRLRAQHRRNQR